MTFSEIKALSEMGFTTEQIMQLSVIPEQPQEQPEQPAEEQPQEQPEQPAGEQPQEDNRITQLQAEVENLKKQLQKQNRQTARMETLPDDLDKTVDGIMAELIRPTIKEEK